MNAGFRTNLAEWRRRGSHRTAAWTRRLPELLAAYDLAKPVRLVVSAPKRSARAARASGAAAVRVPIPSARCCRSATVGVGTPRGQWRTSKSGAILPDHHVRAVFRLGRGTRQGRQPRRRRGRSPATSLDGDEREPTIECVMVRPQSRSPCQHEAFRWRAPLLRPAPRTDLVRCDAETESGHRRCALRSPSSTERPRTCGSVQPTDLPNQNLQPTNGKGPRERRRSRHIQWPGRGHVDTDRDHDPGRYRSHALVAWSSRTLPAVRRPTADPSRTPTDGA